MVGGVVFGGVGFAVPVAVAAAVLGGTGVPVADPSPEGAT